jgi:hypothetical protein
MTSAIVCIAFFAAILAMVIKWERDDAPQG